MKQNKIWQISTAIFMVVMLLFTATSPVLASSAGPSYPTVGANVAGSGNAWGGVTNIYTNDSNYASVTLNQNATSDYLRGTGFGFSIPAGATIIGIQVVINRYSTGSGSRIRDNVVSLVKAGTITGDNKAVTGTEWPINNPLSSTPYGATNDLWGTTWTPSDINNANFGVVLAVKNASTFSSRTAYVNFFTITVTYNQPPTDVSLTNSSIAENSPVDTVVGTLSTIDPDTGDTFTYTLSGADAGSFNISGSNLRASAPFNYEVKNSYSVTVRSTDQNGLFYEKTFVISVTDVNEPPVINSNGAGPTAAINVIETFTAVTTVTAVDPDAGTTLTYSKSGVDEGFFSLDPSSGVLAFITAPAFATPLDANADNVYEVTVQVSDGSMTDSQAISVTVLEFNNPPVITQGDAVVVNMDEDNAPTAFSLTLNATHADLPPLTWSITVPALHGTAGASGTGLSKVITYIPTANYNGTDSFTVQVTDGALWDSIVVNVNIAPIADIYYVDNTQGDASDSNPGTDPTLPLLTISRGAVLARAGDTVHVLAGVYTEWVLLDTYSGVAGFPITFKADPGVTASGNGVQNSTGAAFSITLRSYIVIDGFTITGTAYTSIYVADSNHITISNNTISNAGKRVYGQHQYGIRFRTVVDSIIDGNTTFDNTCIGIRLTHASNNNVLSKNISYGNYSSVAVGEPTDAAGIEVDDSDYNLLIHNITYSNEDTGINFYITSGTGAKNNMAIGNLSYGNGDHGIDNNNSSGQIIVGNTIHGNFTSGINLEANSGGATLANNILSDNGLAPTGGRKAGNIYVDETSYTGTNLDYNLYYLSGGSFQINWNGTNYTTLAAFKAAIPTQEVRGLEGNPLFVAPAPVSNGSLIIAVGDYHLQALSPAIDSANSAAPSHSNTDLDGNARVDDPAVANTGAGPRLYDDRGAYERMLPFATTLTVLPVTDTYGNTVALSATLIRTSNSQALNNKLVSFTLNGGAACSGTTNSSGVATCNVALLVDVATYPTGVGASFAGDTQYAASTGTNGLTVNPKALTVTGITASNKIYDGNPTAVLNTLSAVLVGKVGSDDVTLITTGATGTFSDKNVANGKLVTVSGLTLGGVKAGNYTVTQPTTTADITPKGLTVTGVTADNKVYDGGTPAVLNTGSAVLVGVVSPDVVTINAVGAIGTFSDKNVANGKTVTVSGLILAGTDNGNYTLTQPTTTANITAKELTVTGVSASSKVYDGGTTAALTTAGAALVGKVGTEDVTLNLGGAVGSFSDKSVANGKLVTISGLTISGLDIGNYTLTQPTATANITPKGLTVTAFGVNKIYDGSTAATVTFTDDRISGDVLIIDYTANFADKNAGTSKAVNVTGISISSWDAGNYSLLNTTTSTIANITPKHITGIFTAADKIYDGNTSATVLTRLPTGVIGIDVVTLVGGVANFEDATIGMNKIVTLTSATLGGADVGNYILDSVATTTASIYATLAVTNLDLLQANLETGPYSPVPGTFAGGFTMILNPTLEFYYLDVANLVANRPLANGYYPFIVTNHPADYFTYWANLGVVNGATGWQGVMWQIINGNAPFFYLKVSNNGTSFDLIDGLDYVLYPGEDRRLKVNGTYLLGGYAFSGTVSDGAGFTNVVAVNITFVAPNMLSVSGITAANKAYDGSPTAVLNTGSAVLVGVESGDSVTLVTSAATGAFNDKNIGIGKTVTVSGLTITGADASKYTLVQPTTTADITAKELTVTGITAANKAYDGGTAAVLNTAGAALVGKVGTEDVTLNVSGAVGAFGNKNIGNSKPVAISGLIISGADIGNYTLTQPTTTANITAKELTVTGITAANKIYDGGTAAVLNTAGAALVGKVGTEDVTLNVSGAAGAFGDKNIGNSKPVAISGLIISGADIGNYTLTQPTTTANITAKELTVTGITAASKIYDGGTAAAPNTAGAALVGKVGTEDVTLNVSGAVGAFGDKNIGNSKPVAISGLIISGADIGNYTLTQPTTTANITAKELTVTGITAASKIYDGGTAAVLNTAGAALVGKVGTEDVTLNVSGAAGAFGDKNIGNSKPVAISGLIISGADIGNYTLTQPTTTANITAKELTVTGITAANKIYDGGTTAALNTAGATLVGKVGAEDVTLNLVAAVGAFSDKNIGNGKTVTVSGLTVTGTAIGNYTLTQPTTTADITAKELTVTGITAANKAYDGGTAAVLNTAGAALVGKVGTEDVTLNVSGAVGAFGDKNIGNSKPVAISGLIISGADIGNYTLTQPTTTANITAKELTVTGITAASKIYDGGTAAAPNTAGAALVGKVGTEDVTLNVSGAVGTFSDKNVGNGKTVTVSGLTISGAAIGNYTLTQPSTTANITVRDLTVTATGVHKVYDATTTATVTFTDDRVSGDVLTINYTANFADANIGTAKAVSVTGISISGLDAGNYNLVNTTAATTANITPKPITVTVNSGQHKMFGESDPIFTYAYAPMDTPASFTGVLTRDPGEKMGSYTINQGSLSAGSNFTISFVSAKFTITGYTLSLPLISK